MQGIKNYTYDERTGILRIDGMKEPIVCASPLMQEVIEKTIKFSQCDKVPVLITGETGVGKGLIAKALHYLRTNLGEFTKVNCSSLVETLFESEIFGHVPGAFTGATQNKRGVFSSNGTVLLDEIGDISLRSQNSLRSAIQDREFRKVGQGSGNSQKLEARIIAATNLDLEEAISEKKFKEDLYYRLNVLEIRIPPLRKREEDILVLKDIFLKKYCKEMKKEVRLDEHAISELKNYPFPGNVRELENLIQRAVVMTEDRKEYKSFERDFRKGNDYQSKENRKDKLIPLGDLKGDDFEEKIAYLKLLYLKKALVKNGFNPPKAARLLSYSRRSVYNLLKKNNTSIEELRDQYYQNPDSYFEI